TISDKITKYCKTLFVLSDIIYPLNPLQYINVYFKNCEETSSKNKSKVKFLINLVNLLASLKAAHLCYLAFDPNLTELDRAIHFDANRVLIPKAAHNFVVAIAVSMAVYFNVILFFKVDNRLNLLIQS